MPYIFCLFSSKPLFGHIRCVTNQTRDQEGLIFFIGGLDSKSLISMVNLLTHRKEGLFYTEGKKPATKEHFLDLLLKT